MKTLNTQQLQAYNRAIEFLNTANTNEMLLIEGYAGTGKTYLVGKLVDWIIKNKHCQIACSAPTNKAVKVLRKSSGLNAPNIHFNTIHSLLGLVEMITDSGEQIFVSSNYEKTKLDDYKILIIDEVSMLSDDLFLKIKDHAKKIKIIFMGDPAQIPPVMKNDCIPFLPEREQYNITVVKLTDIMRQKKGNKIIETSFSIRKALNTIPHINRETNDNVIHIDSSIVMQRDEFLETLETYFTSFEFQENSDHAKVISWTNKSVNQMNDLIRKMIFKDSLKKDHILPKVMIGEKLIANKPIVEKTPTGTNILFTSNDEFEVISYEIKTDKRFFFYYDTLVEYTNFKGLKQKQKIKILHEDSESEFNKKLNEIKKEALSEFDGSKKKQIWRYYYDFLAEFADITYNYAITCHKSQGSTYDNTFILEDDINKNNKIVERNRILYTAVTRAKEKLFLICRQ